MQDLILYLLFVLAEFFICIAIKRTNNKLFTFLFVALFVIFIGCRYYVGTDYKNYLIVFDDIKLLKLYELLSYKWEIAFKLIFKIVSLIFVDGKFVFPIIALLNVIPFLKSNKLFNYKYLPFSFLLYFLIFLPFCMNGMRQGVAMSFILYSILLLVFEYRKKSIIYLELVLFP